MFGRVSPRCSKYLLKNVLSSSTRYENLTDSTSIDFPVKFSKDLLAAQTKSKNEFVVRQATQDDMVPLYLFNNDKSLEDYKDENRVTDDMMKSILPFYMYDHNYTVYVAKDDKGRILASASVGADDEGIKEGEAFIEFFKVAPVFNAIAVGHAILEEAENSVKDEFSQVAALGSYERNFIFGISEREFLEARGYEVDKDDACEDIDGSVKLVKNCVM